MRMILTGAVMAAAVLTGANAMAQSGAPPQTAALAELAPKGPVRVAIAISPAPSALYAVKDASGNFKGVTVDLGNALAAKLGRPVQFVPYLASGEITANANKDAWDVTFMPYDATRAKSVDFGSAYHLLQSTYLVTAKSGIKTMAEVDRPNVRIAGVEGTATGRAAAASLKQAKIVSIPGVDAGVAMLNAGQAEAIALSRESLTGLVPKIPGSHILEGGFLNSVTAAAVPKGKPAALAWVSAFVEEQKANGNVRKSFDAMGLKSSVVAPAGMKP